MGFRHNHRARPRPSFSLDEQTQEQHGEERLGDVAQRKVERGAEAVAVGEQDERELLVRDLEDQRRIPVGGQTEMPDDDLRRCSAARTSRGRSAAERSRPTPLVQPPSRVSSLRSTVQRRVETRQVPHRRDHPGGGAEPSSRSSGARVAAPLLVDLVRHRDRLEDVRDSAAARSPRTGSARLTASTCTSRPGTESFMASRSSSARRGSSGMAARRTVPRRASAARTGRGRS